MGRRKRVSKNTVKPKFSTYLKGALISLVLLAVLIAFAGYFIALKPNVKSSKELVLYIPSNATYPEVLDSLKKQVISNKYTFKWMAELMGYPSLIKGGRYVLAPDLNNLDLIRKLRAGIQDPILVTLSSKRTYQEALGQFSHNLECDSLSMVDEFESTLVGVKGDVRGTYLIPNTYEFYWNTSCVQVVRRLLDEQQAFWNTSRLEKAKKLGLSKEQVFILASIVQKETAKEDEMPRVAGVYLNRLKKGMKLQADPTLVYLLKVKMNKVGRVLNEDKKIKSPYNTYIYKGLPPGPIYIASPKVIDATLNAESHAYLYFCAKEDFSGYHNFAKTYREHLSNAQRYHRELNRRKIFR
ncbi:endolytic transglycosylase MltG [Luteibaculum oceani]|uniref:Endolytic murein transglycosylase n=1 Tax=Luteibaculum oceani TaxID=1294296 RepID=A0A5C6VE84_9FLAO|nr:endolytic transglycosylase MltG [Luteibaculum oceani]TXC81378.1 endolytic transglycosylase MltG [Luteibaculum oceani]